MQVEAFLERPLEGEHPYLWLDAKQVKVRDDGHVRSKALVIAYAVHETGRREVIGLDLGEVESEAFWTELLRDLKRRGLQGVRLCVKGSRILIRGRWCGWGSGARWFRRIVWCCSSCSI